MSMGVHLSSMTQRCGVQILWCAYVSLMFYAKPQQLPDIRDALP